VRAGEVYENRVQGDRFFVREGGEDTGGERLVGDLYIRPGGAIAGKHVHSYITEWFEVLAGTVGFHVDGRDELARVGEKVEVPPGAVHAWWNAGEDEAHVLVEIRPAERFELMIQNLYGLANDGKSNAKGVPRLLPLALFAREFRLEGEFIRPPRLVQRLVFAVLAPLARARGYRAVNPQYLGPTGKAAARGAATDEG
jgi:quercetin dioxygenase-like cupin family protein